eukprot:4908881-Pleurochrysis_carterae.AAC.1
MSLRQGGASLALTLTPPETRRRRSRRRSRPRPSSGACFKGGVHTVCSTTSSYPVPASKQSITKHEAQQSIPTDAISRYEVYRNVPRCIS